MASTDPTPSYRANIASFIMGISTRLDTKPGESLTSTGIFPSAKTSSCVTEYVASDVAIPRMTSTSFITGTGFMKCIPIKRSDRCDAAASLVIDIELVLLASITSSLTTLSSAVNRSDLIRRFSVTASITKSASRRSTSSVDGLIREMIWSFSSWVARCLSTSQIGFNPQVLRHRLDHEIRVAQVNQFCRRLDSRNDLVLLFLGCPLLVDISLKALPDSAESPA